MQKMAEAVREELRSEGPMSIIGKSLLGLGVGTAAGYGSGLALDHLLTKARGTPVSPHTAAKFMPLVGGAIGLAAPHFYQMTQQKAQQAHLKQEEKRRDRPRT
jgi:hypothetical protein